MKGMVAFLVHMSMAVVVHGAVKYYLYINTFMM
jgi:hypothetical protein